MGSWGLLKGLGDSMSQAGAIWMNYALEQDKQDRLERIRSAERAEDREYKNERHKVEDAREEEKLALLREKEKPTYKSTENDSAGKSWDVYSDGSRKRSQGIEYGDELDGPTQDGGLLREETVKELNFPGKVDTKTADYNLKVLKAKQDNAKNAVSAAKDRMELYVVDGMTPDKEANPVEYNKYMDAKKTYEATLTRYQQALKGESSSVPNPPEYKPGQKSTAQAQVESEQQTEVLKQQKPVDTSTKQKAANSDSIGTRTASEQRVFAAKTIRDAEKAISSNASEDEARNLFNSLLDLQRNGELTAKDRDRIPSLLESLSKIFYK